MGAEDKIGLQLAGIEFLPPDLFLDKAELIRHLLEAADSGQFDPAQLPFPKLPIRQIFADQQGDHYLVVPTNGDSPLALPYITGSELGNLAEVGQGGYMPVDALIKASPPASSSNNFPDAAALMGQMTTGFAESVAKDGSISDALLGQFQSQLTGLALSQVPEEFRGIAGQVLNQALKKGPELLNGLMSGDLGGVMKNPFDNVGMGDVGSMAVGGLMDMGFSALTDAWKVDDNSSTFAQVAHKYGMQALGMIKGYITQQMQSFLTNAVKGQLSNAMGNLSNGFDNDLASLGKQFDLFFNGMSSGAILPAAHIASKDDKVDVVITGFPTVLVEGKAISRITDLLDPSKKIILEGAATVFAGKMPVGRVTSDTAIPSDLLTGATTVLIGGPSVKISPPIAPKGGAGGGAGGGQASGGRASKGGSGGSGDGNGEGGGKKEEESSCGGNEKQEYDQKGENFPQDEGSTERRREEIRQQLNQDDLTDDQRQALLDEYYKLDKTLPVSDDEYDKVSPTSPKLENESKENSPQDEASAERRREEIRQQLNRVDLTDDQHQALLEEYYALDKAFPGRDDREILPKPDDEKPKHLINFTLPDDIKRKLEEFGGDRKKQIEFLNDMAKRIGGGADFASLTGGIGDTAANQLSLTKLNLQLAAAALEEDPNIALKKTEAILANKNTEIWIKKGMDSISNLSFVPKPLAGTIFMVARPVSKGAGQLVGMYVEGGVKKIEDNIANDFGKVYDSWKAVANMYIGMYLGKKE